jgi:hypothetical protein
MKETPVPGSCSATPSTADISSEAVPVPAAVKPARPSGGGGRYNKKKRFFEVKGQKRKKLPWKKPLKGDRFSPYHDFWKIVDGAIRDALNHHPEYLTDKGRRSLRESILKRAAGALASSRYGVHVRPESSLGEGDASTPDGALK